MIQVMLLVWINEDTAVKTVLMVIAIFGILPILHFIPFGLIITKEPGA
jgi:hypothetical protein